MPLPTTSPAGDSVRCLHLSDFDLRFDRYRLIQPKADLLMARSLAKYSQLAPVIYCQLEGSLVLVDGFKRLRAVRTLKGITSLQARLLGVDEQAAKAAIFNLNLVTSKPNELEESWIIYALVHDDGLPQVEVAQMLDPLAKNDIIARWKNHQSVRRIAKDLHLGRAAIASVIRQHLAQTQSPQPDSASSPPACLGPVPLTRKSKLDPFLDLLKQLQERYPNITVSIAKDLSTTQTIGTVLRGD